MMYRMVKPVGLMGIINLLLDFFYERVKFLVQNKVIWNIGLANEH